MPRAGPRKGSIALPRWPTSSTAPAPCARSYSARSLIDQFDQAVEVPFGALESSVGLGRGSWGEAQLIALRWLKVRSTRVRDSG